MNKKIQILYEGTDTASENTVKETDCDPMFELSFISDVKISLIKSAESLKCS